MHFDQNELTFTGVTEQDAAVVAEAVAESLLAGPEDAAADASCGAAYGDARWAARDPDRFDAKVGGGAADQLRAMLLVAIAQGWETAHSDFEEHTLGERNRQFALRDSRGAAAGDSQWLTTAVTAVLRGSFAGALLYPDAVERGVAAATRGPFRRTP